MIRSNLPRLQELEIDCMQRLAPDEVRVRYQFTESLQDEELRALAEVLSPCERERCSRLVFARDRRDFMAAHALIRRTLAVYGDLSPSEWRFEIRSGGKPIVVTDQRNALAFNLSHTRGLVACAVASGTEVGIDVEAIRDATAAREIASGCFSELENRRLESCSAEEYAERFIELWTLKESFIKAIGAGLNYPLDGFSFDLDGATIDFDVPGQVPSRFWQFALAAPAPGFRLAVAVRCSSSRPRYRITLENIAVPGHALAPAQQSPV